MVQKKKKKKKKKEKERAFCSYRSNCYQPTNQPHTKQLLGKGGGGGGGGGGGLTSGTLVLNSNSWKRFARDLFASL